ncbi:putative dolichyl pyrophosphate Man9GlcNAc2 alpha-13-glucosyltransferase [Taenia solium]|eukprot:TsM_000448000 transcript=TsM_000448000 gene=TsM_000448000
MVLEVKAFMTQRSIKEVLAEISSDHRAQSGICYEKFSDVATIMLCVSSNGLVCVTLSLAFGLCLRSLGILQSYSGMASPPMFGDYEAQRHWMEITINLPISEWYANTSSNDLQYWGLDYPPLTAYHSYILGRVSNAIDPAWTELFISRGLETPKHKRCFSRSFTTCIKSVAILAATVCTTFFLVFLPFLTSFDRLKHVGLRMFPVDRGLFEDKDLGCGDDVVFQ